MNTANHFRGEFEIRIRNKKTKVVFNMNALRLTLRDAKLSLEQFEQFMSEDPLTAVPTIAYFSVLSECVRTDKEFKMNKEQFIAEFFEAPEALEQVTEAIGKALGAEEGEGN